jgi:hypothetical protein
MYNYKVLNRILIQTNGEVQQAKPWSTWISQFFLEISKHKIFWKCRSFANEVKIKNKIYHFVGNLILRLFHIGYVMLKLNEISEKAQRRKVEKRWGKKLKKELKDGTVQGIDCALQWMPWKTRIGLKLRKCQL